MSTIEEVLGGKATWGAAEGDNLPLLEALPERCCSLVVTSPPYEKQRTYGVNFKLKGQAWVDWMIPRVVAMCRACSGLVCVNMAGAVSKGSYSPVVEWLVADLTRHHGIVCGPAPYCYFRFGIPGSGSKHYHRRDWEPVYAFCLPDRLPLAWSANTAEGHTPRYGPGGKMSNRLKDGQRVGKFGAGGRSSLGSPAEGAKEPPRKSSLVEDVTVGGEKPGLFGPVEESDTDGTGRKVGKFGPPSSTCSRKTNGEPAAASETFKNTRKKPPPAPRHEGQRGNVDGVAMPVKANPGSVVREQYDCEEVRQLLEDLAKGKAEYGDVIRCLSGGGAMGSDLAHLNEAPFSERLVRFFVRSFAPPGSIVLDPFCGSGTVLSAAVEHGRRAIGIDLRASQVALTKRRLEGVTPTMFA